MKSLLKKARENKKGFTLAELLVVVAIVGILVAISIPVFTAQLGKARRATNQANLRAAKAAAVAEILMVRLYTTSIILVQVVLERVKTHLHLQVMMNLLILLIKIFQL